MNRAQYQPELKQEEEERNSDREVVVTCCSHVTGSVSQSDGFLITGAIHYTPQWCYSGN